MNKTTEIVKKQIGRYPRSLIKIAKKCRFKLPRIILSSPNFSPTVFWLTCPHDNLLISGLESGGLIKIIKEKLNENSQLKKELFGVNKKYITRRSKFYSYPFPAGRVKSLEEKGIDGIRDLSSLKCLHSHWAHYLVTRKNPVGKIISEHLKNSPRCKKKCFSNNLDKNK